VFSIKEQTSPSDLLHLLTLLKVHAKQVSGHIHQMAAPRRLPVVT
jgi:hypothetical protein